MSGDIINDSAIPKGAGIITFEMIFRAVEKVRVRIDKVEKELADLKSAKEQMKIAPKPIIKAIGKEINITETKTKTIETNKDSKKVK